MISALRLQPLYVLGLMALQIICAAYFAYDILKDIREAKFTLSLYLLMEIMASLGLIAAAILEGNILNHIMREYKKMQQTLQVAQGNVQDVIQNYFNEWNLTKAEIDVALLAIKGFSISEIAGYRNSQEGTVKTQLSAVYRKAGVKGRNQLGSLLIEDLMGQNTG